MKQLFFTLRAMATLAAIVFFGLGASAQVTTATVTGTVRAADGEALPGARIEAVHVPSGSRYGTTANADGRFTLPNLRVGGPYVITYSMQSFESQKREGVWLSLGQKVALDASLKESAKALGEVVVSGTLDDVVNNQRTGAATNVGRDQIATLPTISRSAFDYTRLSPAAAEGSFGGRNDQYNNFSLDGAIFNNPFGLDAATVGGQSEAQPIPLDAIDQIQVAYAPYDVSQSGFTGAAINAVTKSGTNDFEGSVYGFYRNQNMVGSKVDGEDALKGDLTQFQTGLRLGGPIVKNKVFFFVNAELERRSDLGSAYLANRGTTGPGISRVLASDLDLVSSTLRKEFGYETGPYENFTLEAPNVKGIAKLDFNLATNHKLTLTYNFLDASKEKPAHPSAIGRRGPDFTTLQFKNSGYRINNKLNSYLAELKSAFGDRVANKFQVGFQQFRDTRDPFSTAFPTINIEKDGLRYIVAGHEPFSIYNRLNQDVLLLSDKLDFYLGKHTLTVGAAFEKFAFDNSFNLGAYPGAFGLVPLPPPIFSRDFASMTEFIDSVNSGFLDPLVTAAKDTFNTRRDQDWNWSYTNLGQISLYLQDEMALNKNFTLTVGLRIDRPEYFNTQEKIKEKLKNPVHARDYQPDNQYFDEDGKPIKFDHTVLPKETPLFNPRVGFNYDIRGDKTMQLRGGTGLFSGRLPFVWIGNHVANPNFFFYCVTRDDFKFPQVWNSSLGYDQKWGDGWVGSVDFRFSKDINGMMVRNYGLNKPTGRLESPGDNRPIYTDANRAKNQFGGATDAFVFTNTNVGRAINASLEVKRTWSNGMSASLGYNFTDATDASSIEAEISSDAYDRNPAYGHVNEAVEAPSLYGNRHRVVGTFLKKFRYGGDSKDKMATTIGLFFQYAQGGRFSYTYSGNINNDGSRNNDLMYIPTDAEVSLMKFSGDADAQQTQREAFKDFIAQDDYLSENRGSVVEKYGILSPWYNNWDVRVLQDFNVNLGQKTRTVQVSLDLLNAGNLLSNKWGVRRIPSTTQPLGVSVDPATSVPTYSFDTAIKETFVQDFGLVSRWQAQVGLRLIF